MKTYQVNYTDHRMEIVYETSFEAKNLKEAKKMAQSHKKNTPEIQKAGRVRTSVGLKAEVLRELKNLIQEIDNL